MERAILIVDPQLDFISGSLAVPGAAHAMDELASHMKKSSYDLKIITCDNHPYGHCSFNENGGQWPRHCLQFSQGAAIYGPVLDMAHKSPGAVKILTKGEVEDKEEYSIFAARAPELDQLFREFAITQVDICGIAGDICVLNTLRDGINIYGRGFFNILPHLSPSLDGGKALQELCHQ